MNVKYLLLLIFYSSLKCSESARILGMFPIAGKSVNILYDKLCVALANAGHAVTQISAYRNKAKIQNGSLRHIFLTGFYEEYEQILKDFDTWDIKEESTPFESKEFLELFVGTWNRTFQIPEVKQLLNSNEKFDAIILEDLWNDNFKILGKIFNCPIISFSSIGGNNPWLNSDIGNPLPPSYIPHYYMVGDFTNGMTFLQRTQSFVFYLIDSFIRYYYMFPVFNDILKSNFDNPPDVASFYNNISLVLLGSHSSLREPAPLLPNVIEIGGFHIDPPKKLPAHLQDFLDGAKDGAIFFSLGSHANSKDMPEKIKKIFLSVFGKIKQRIIWKFEEDLPGKPDNVLISKWLPQMDILAHPNIKLFITHGGHGSFIETIYHGVPCLMFPLFFDQFALAYKAVSDGYGLKISYNDENFNEVTLMNTLTELLTNPKYKEKAVAQQRLFHDRPMKPLDTAIYWIEYVIRHKGADHLKVRGRTMPWYQFYSVDVIVFLLSIFILILYILYLVLRTLFCKKRNVQKLKIN